MAFGRKQPQSYGVPVRAAVPPPPPAEPVAAYVPAQPTHQPAQSYPYAVAAPASPGYSAPAMPANPYSPPPVAAPTFYSPTAPQPGFYLPTPSAPGPAPFQQYAPYQPYGMPAQPFQPPYLAPSKPTMRTPFKIAGGVVVALFVVGGIWSAVDRRSPITPPATLGGMSMVTDSQTVKANRHAASEMKKDNNGAGATVALYVSGDGESSVFLLALRGRTQEARELRDMEEAGIVIDRASRRDFGGVTCWAGGDLNLDVCMWSGEISGGIMTSSTGNLADSAAIAEEARSALN